MQQRKNNLFKYLKEGTLFKHIKSRYKYTSLMKHGYKYNDKEYLIKLGEIRLGYKMNLDKPVNFNEKLNWIKLNDRKDIYTIMSDKYCMKDFVSSKLFGAGHQYVVPLIGVWDKAEDIDFDKLPNKFVLKCNHNSGKGMYICRDKTKLTKKDIKEILKHLNEGLKQDYFLTAREWPYKNIKRKIIAEEFLEENTRKDADSLIDYKWFCFNGEPKLMYIGNDASFNPTCDWFDMNFNHIDMHDKDPNSKVLPSKPELFEKMKEIAKILSSETKFLRVDYYVVNGKLYVGELTFFHSAGFGLFYPEEINDKLGELIKLED